MNRKALRAMATDAKFAVAVVLAVALCLAVIAAVLTGAKYAVMDVFGVSGSWAGQVVTGVGAAILILSVVLNMWYMAACERVAREDGEDE